MFTNFYPRDQIKRYLLIDVASIIFLFYMVFSQRSELSFMIKMMLIISFLLCYYISLWVRDYRLIITTFVGCIILTIFTIYIDHTLIIYGFIFADMLGRVKEKIYMGFGILILALMFVTVIFHGGGIVFFSQYPILLPLMIFQMVLPIVINIVEKSKHLQVELNEANEMLEKYIQEEERNRIARDLHDTLGQTLTMIKVKSELTERLIDKDPEVAKKEIRDILSSSRKAIKQVRELVTGMKYISLEDEIELSKKQLHDGNIKMVIRKGVSIPSIPKMDETMLSLSVREVITNIIRHSQAMCCSLTLESNPQNFVIIVEDDGIGIRFNSHRNGYGLLSIEERLRSINGTCTIHSSTGKGTRIILEVPLRKG